MTAQKMDALDIEIYQLMKELGIPASMTGYDYLRSAIRRSAENGCPKISTMSADGIYPRIAEEFGVSSNSVERAIRKSIGVGVERAGGSKFYKVFGLSMDADKARPTNAQFIRQAALEALCRESKKNLKTAGQKRETWQIG